MIKTIEKLLGCFRLRQVPAKKFKDTTKTTIPSYFVLNWKNKRMNENISRLNIYKSINNDFTLLKYLGLPYHLRKVVSGMRCSRHPLVIEKGRQKKKQRYLETRDCAHFVKKELLKTRNTFHSNVQLKRIPPNRYAERTDLLNMDNQYKLAHFLLSTLEFRQRLIWGRVGE